MHSATNVDPIIKKLYLVSGSVYTILYQRLDIPTSVYPSLARYQERVNLWTEDKYSDITRSALAKKLFGQNAVFPQTNPLNWHTRRDWVYKTAYNVPDFVYVASAGPTVVNETRETKSKIHPEIAFALDMDQVVAEALYSGKLALSTNQNTFVFSGDKNGVFAPILTKHQYPLDKIDAAVEWSLERLHTISPDALNIKQMRNPGLILGHRLVLSELTRTRLAEDRTLQGWNRVMSKELHPDRNSKDGERARQINWAFEVLTDRTKFELWKSDRLTFKFP